MPRRHDSCEDEKLEFVVVLTGSQEVPPAQTPALGAGELVLSRRENKLCFRFYFENLTSPVIPGFVHFHRAPAGQNGPVVKDLAQFVKFAPNRRSGRARGVWSKHDPTQPLTNDLVQALKAGELYINIHTEAYPGGEVRGQVVRLNKH